MQPGQTIAPGGSSPQAVPPSPKPQTAPPSPVVPSQQSPNFAAKAADDGIGWTASEYLVHQKNGGWYVVLLLGALAAAVLAYVLTHDVITVAMLVIVAVIFAVVAARQPRVIDYHLSRDGLSIGGKFYPYDEFKTFSLLQDGSINSVLLLPMRRLMPAVTLYYPPEQERAILGMLSDYLPHEERKVDLVDRLMRKVRF